MMRCVSVCWVQRPRNIERLLLITTHLDVEVQPAVGRYEHDNEHDNEGMKRKKGRLSNRIGMDGCRMVSHGGRTLMLR